MEISPKNQNPDDDELLTFLEGVCSIASLTSTCQEADFSGVSPSESKQGSAQWWAYLFGSIVAWYVLKDKEWRLNLFNEGEFIIDGKPTNIWVWDDIWGDSDEKGAPDRKVPLVVGSLLSDYDDSRDWKALLEHYLCMWSGSYTSYGKPLSEVGPEDDLYWAMRIGFADQMLSGGQPNIVLRFAEETLERQQSITPPPGGIADIPALKEYFAKLDGMNEKLDKLLQPPPSNQQETHRNLQQRLSSVWDKLPRKVVDTLVKAENYYKTGVNTDDAKVWFNRAVEASLNCCLVEPLVSFTQKRDDKRIAVCFPSPRGVERKTSHELRKLFLWEWSDVFETLSMPAHHNLASLGAEDFNRFMKEHFGELPLPALKELSRSLGDFCQHRKDSAHAHIPRYEEEIQELEQMRELVLGTKRVSVITQIFQLFGTEK